MKKLFLTSFAFTTGETQYNESRLVVVTKDDIKRVTEKQNKLLIESGRVPTPEMDALDVAYDMAKEWFPTMYPESKLISVITHESINGSAFTYSQGHEPQINGLIEV
jgi:hypothetical protein